jgi:yecA family protein
MTLDEIREAFEGAYRELPTAALRAAVDRAAELAPSVIAVCDAAADGDHLMPREELLLLYGLHALAAARQTSVYRSLLRLLERPERDLDRLLTYNHLGVAARLLASLYDGDAEPIYAMIERLEVDDGVRATLFDVLARLVWEGRADRGRFVELLDRVDREGAMPPDDFAWHGWQSAVMYLGLTEFEGRVRRGWDAGRMRFLNDADRADWRERLRRAAASPESPALFGDDWIEPIDDPADALGWLARHLSGLEPEPSDPDDPAQAIRLSTQEIGWLDGFLLGERVPEGMSLEQLDGFFSALLCGPRPASLVDSVPRVWGTERQAPAFDTPAQREFVMALLERHWRTIQVRLELGFPHDPILMDGAEDREGQSWAYGFLEAVEMSPSDWTPLIHHHAAQVLLAGLAALECGRDGGKPLSRKNRKRVLEAMPLLPAMIRRFWLSPDTFGATVRSGKIGRNDPCPCGSGRKYKKCCGAGRSVAP